MVKHTEKLFSDFTAPSRQEWRDKIEVDLKGADYQKKMVWRTNEGFSMEPFYRKEDVDKLPLVNALPGEFPFVRGNKKADNQWYVRQNIVADDPKEANQKALDILNRGVNSLGFRIPGEKVSKEFIETLLDGILLDCVEVSYRTCQRHVVELTDILLDYFQEKGYKKDALVGGIGFDPIERMLMKGKDTTMLLPQMPVLVEKLKDYPGLRCVMVHSDLLCNSGAYVYQELGYALAWGKEYLDEMVEAARRPGRQENQVLHGHRWQLLHGDCQVPCRSYAVGTDCEAVRAQVRLRLPDGCQCVHHDVQPNRL